MLTSYSTHKELNEDYGGGFITLITKQLLRRMNYSIWGRLLVVVVVIVVVVVVVVVLICIAP